ncbi:unnamed protein product [Moneuplotes crassus]|uniref:Uncharacterized protein n=1 Tax=Euplotes crassus TaxID=5936 RepID=A0AAD1U9J0_EUPCR|nr:unnamed protein product [Moneuplotes crassus]
MEATKTFDLQTQKHKSNAEGLSFDELYESLTKGVCGRGSQTKIPEIRDGILVSSTPPRVNTKEIEVDAFLVESFSKKSNKGKKPKKKEQLNGLRQENEELRKQINDLKVTLKINKDCMNIMLEPSNRFQQINIVNSFVKENIKLQNEVFRVQKKLIAVLHSQILQKKDSFVIKKDSFHQKKIDDIELPTKPIEKSAPCQNPEQDEPEIPSPQTEYISQLKDNNKVLKDLIRNKNKEIVSLEMTIKKDKISQRKEMMECKKEKNDMKAKLKKYQDFVKGLLGNYMDVAIPVITDDIHIVTDCSHLMWIPEKLVETQSLFQADKVLPEGFEESLEKLKEEIKNMQDQGEGDQEEEFDDDQEENDQANFDDQIINFTEPVLNRHKVSRGNSATVIMMGQEEAERFFSSRLDNNTFYQQSRGTVRYVSNVPESFNQLKYLKTFKDKGKWKLAPKDQDKNEFDESENDEEYYEYDDYEDELENNGYGGAVDSSREDNKSSSISPKNKETNGISITNLNKFYKK